MITLFIILIVIASVALGLIVLVQNPKGGGLAGSIGGFSSQFMGVKQTNDVLEKAWVFAGLVGALCLLSVFFISKSSSTVPDRTIDATGAPVPSTSQPLPSNTVPLTPTPAPTTPQTP
ncbi:MAG: preprotein translocase subunit SecG [Chitinophagaceae bacterium]|nr:preprotein translocase subunit SecG [Chitinophagaceae bacterium]